VCIAALGKVVHGVVEDVAIALGSVAPVPLRLTRTEFLLVGKKAEPALVRLAKQTVAQQIRPVSDIRSTAQYRAAVAANLVEEFVEELCALAGRR
jgi:CO/xanthine dehydrogenase FAD-binding subunit